MEVFCIILLLLLGFLIVACMGFADRVRKLTESVVDLEDERDRLHDSELSKRVNELENELQRIRCNYEAEAQDLRAKVITLKQNNKELQERTEPELHKAITEERIQYANIVSGLHKKIMEMANDQNERW